MWLVDSFLNFMSGLGTAKDKTVGNQHVFVPRSLAECRAAYRGNWIARKVVDIVPFDMLREGRAWQAAPKEVDLLEASEKALGVQGKLLDGLKRARLEGGSAIVVGADGAVSSELLPERLGQGGIRWLHVFGREEIQPAEPILDPDSPWFGEPTTWQLNSRRAGAVQIHPSRVIRLVGAPILDTVSSQAEQGWGDSVLQAVFAALDQATSSPAYLAALLPEAKQDIISVPGLSSHLKTAASTAELTKRFQYAAQAKSMFGMLLLEGDGKTPTGELFQQKQINFSGLPDVVKLFLMIAAAASDIPSTRFLSQSPQGMNATGDSDTRNYYDRCASGQKVELTPAIKRLDELLIWNALGSRPASIWYEWRPLYQPTQKEKGDAFKVLADGLKVIADAGLAPLEVLGRGAKGMVIDTGLFPGIEKAYQDHGDAPLTEPPVQADQYDPYGYPAEGYTGTDGADNVIPFPGMARDAAPRTLYVSRKLKNGDDVLAWARSQGFADLMPAGELHVTIAYSRTAVDWMKIGQTWNGEELKISAGGPRLVERFGEAIVLLFASDELRWRHQEIREAGASWDHPEYQPHVTVTWNAGDVDLAEVEPYNGPLVFGPEIFEPVDEDWRAGLTADAAADLEEADEPEIAAVSLKQLRALFGEEVLSAEGIRLDDKAPHHGPRHGGGPDLGGAFNELLHPRGPGGKFAPKGAATKPAAGKPGAKKGSAAASKPTKGQQALKSAGVGHDDEIRVLSKRVRAYAGATTVRDFVDSHPKGKAYALRKLAADHAKGAIGFKAVSGTAAPRAAANPEKYNPDNFSDFSDTDHKTTIQVERDLYKQMLGDTERQAEIGAIARYSGNGYTGINGFLRGDGGKAAAATVYANTSYGTTIQNIDGVLARSRMTEDTVVYRGVKGAFAQKLRGVKVGSVITDRGYVSTSLKGDTSKAFAGGDGVVLKMLLPKGNPAYVMNGRGASHYPKEHEILLPRKSRFRVASLEGNVLTVEVL